MNVKPLEPLARSNFITITYEVDLIKKYKKSVYSCLNYLFVLQAVSMMIKASANYLPEAAQMVCTLLMSCQMYIAMFFIYFVIRLLFSWLFGSRKTKKQIVG